MKSEESCCWQRYWMAATLDSTSPSMGISHNKERQRNISWRYGEICTSCDIILQRLYASQSSEHGTSSGGLNTVGNLSDSSDAVFLQIIYHPSRFLDKSSKRLIAKCFICVADGLKWGFIPHASLTILALSLTILLMLLSKKAFLRLKLASLAFEVSFISNWFGAQIKFTWGSIKVYVRFTSDSNEAQFDFFYVLLLKRKRIHIYTSYKSKKQCCGV